MDSKLCSVCIETFSGLCPAPFKGKPHHQSTQAVLEAAAEGCYVCGVIVKSDEFQTVYNAKQPFSAKSYANYLPPESEGGPSTWMHLTIDALGEDDIDGNQDEEEEEKEEALIWGFLLLPVEAHERNVGDYDPTSDGLENPTLLDLPVQWFNECAANHSKCDQKIPGYYPTRLLEIVNPSLARLVVTKDHGMKGRYASLSHCWGTAKTLKLLTSNINHLCTRGIEIPTLPQSYREAITVCLRFGFRYIWIDSLCIVQDSHDDWQREAMTMKDVYQNSVLNIAAAAAANNSDASFQSRQLEFIRPSRVTPRWEDYPKRCYYLVDEMLYHKTIEQMPLYRRAWVMQEITLTTRNLSLTATQLWWRCSELEACETYPSGVPAGFHVWLPNNLEPKSARDDPRVQLYNDWKKQVERYSSCLISFPSDRIIAFAGIAQEFLSRIEGGGKAGGDTYLAGLWRSQLPQRLCWKTLPDPRQCYRPQGGYSAPSWSWASVEGPVWFDRQFVAAEEGRSSDRQTD